MERNLEKPITVIRQEFIEGLADYINNSGLPLFMLETILKDVYMEIRDMSQKQYEFEKKQYEDALKKAEDEDKDKDK
jgi:hypothetical protein